MSTPPTPQDEIAAMQATLARHEEDLERLKQWLPESGDATGSLLESIVAELTATRDGIRRELRSIHERLDVLTAAQANANREIAGLKDDFAGLKSDVTGLKDDVVSIKGEIASVKETVAMLVARTNALVAQYDAMSQSITAMSQSITVIESRVGNLTGSRYERRVARNIRGILRRSVRLSQAQILHRDWAETDDDLIDLLDAADDRGAITRREREDVLDADIITAGVNPDGQRAYAVIEIGVTTESVDVNRAARRARTIAKATGAECSAVVVGREIPAAEQARATRAGVALVTVTDAPD